MIIIEFITIMKVSLVYLLLFISVELFYRKFKPKPETTRKFIHFFSGIIAIFFPFLFHYVSSIIFMGILFTIILYIAKRTEILTSATDVDRKTMGEVYFPISIMLLFILAHQHPVLYIISVLMLAISDPVGAIIGKTYGSIKYKVQTDEKSMEGSFMFFLVSFLVIHLGLLIFTDISRINTVLISFLASLIVTALESISLEGMDNIFIPLGTFLILFKLSTKSFDTVLLNVMAVSMVILISFILSVKIKKISFSGLVTIVLFGYASWMLANVMYYVAIVSFLIGFLFMNIVFNIKPDDKTNMFRVKPILYIVMIPFVIVFIANILSLEKFFFISFIISGGIQFTLLWRHWCIDGKINNPLLVKYKYIFQHFGVLFAGLFLLLLPIIYYDTENKFLFIIIFFISIIVSDIFYSVLRLKIMKKISYWRNRRLRLLINTFIISIVIFIQNYYIGTL